MESPGLDEILPEMILADIASLLSPVDFANFRQCSKRCLTACALCTNRISSFLLESAKYTNGKIEFRGNSDETNYYVDGQGEVRLPKEYDDERQPTMRIMPIERGIKHFFNRFTHKRPDHITLSVVPKYISNEACEEVFAEILKLYAQGVRIRCRKLTCSVDTVERFQLLTHMFQCSEYEIHGVGNGEMVIDQLSHYVRDCSERVYIDQFVVDVRQITAKNLHIWQTNLTLDELTDFCRTRTKKKVGFIVHLNVTHEILVDLDEVISRERQRLNPVDTPFEDYTTYVSKVQSTELNDNQWVFDVQFRWYVI